MKIKASVPTGFSISADVPEDLDPKLIRLALIAFLGGLVAVTKAEEEETKRTFFIRFIASIIGEANAAVHSTQMSNKMTDKSPKKIIDDLLNNLNHTKGG